MSSSILEISIILIIILLIFGAILNSVENTAEKIVNVEEQENMEKMVFQVCDNLINNPGTPDNWQEHEKGTPGLAIINDGGAVVPNSVEYSKLIVLGKNYEKLVTNKLFNSKIKTSMELIPQESSISSVKIGCEGDSSSIFSVNRLVKCDFHKNYVKKDFQNEGKCNREHDQKYHSCNYFKVFPVNLRNSDFYLLIDDDEMHDLEYYVDTTRVVKERYWETPTSGVIYLNDKIDFYDDDSAIVFIHLNKPKAKAVLISVPKNFDTDNLEYDYFRTNDCKFILKAWY